MIVITMTNCPKKLRGDMSKWLFEVNTGIYVGNLSAKVRDALWERICENVKDGQVSMIYSAQNEQHFEFRVHNTTRKVRDFDGIKLMMNPSSVTVTDERLQPGFSKYSKRRIAQRRSAKSSGLTEQFAFIDIETTGLDPSKDSIIEIAALTASKHEIVSSWSRLIKTDKSVPKNIVELTNITNDMLNGGTNISEALRELSELVQGKSVICYNKKFDITFLQNEFHKNSMDSPFGRVVDLLTVAKRKVVNVENYKLSTVAQHLDIGVEEQHRALSDCETLYKVFLKLNEK